MRALRRFHVFETCQLLPQAIEGIRGSDLSGSNPLILLAPRDGFEPSTQRLTAACSTTELPGIRAGPEEGARHQTRWRPEAESNRCTRICSRGGSGIPVILKSAFY